MLFCYGDFIDTTLVATAFEVGVEVCLHDLKGEVLRDEAGGKGEDVGIVVLTGQASQLGLPTQGGTDALVLVEGHGDTVAGAADGDAAAATATFHRFGAWVGIVGIVARGFGIGAEVLKLIAFGAEPQLDSFFELITGMVAAQADFCGIIVHKSTEITR